MEIQIAIGPGELFDRISILELKSRLLADPAARGRAAAELAALSGLCDSTIAPSAGLEEALAELRAVNDALWRAEDDIRACEAVADFGPSFVELARSIYRMNDQRAAAKRRINLELGARLVEDKSYARVR